MRGAGLPWRAPSLQAGPTHADFLAGLCKVHPDKDGSQSTRMARAASRGERVCLESSAPHLSSLTVGEWSPEGLGGRLPPGRETDRLKPRQPREGILTTVAAPWSRGGQRELCCFCEQEPEGSRERLLGPKHAEGDSD